MRWKVDLFAKILPRHMEILALIDYFFVEKLQESIKNDSKKLYRMQLLSVDEDGSHCIRIAHLCFVASKSVFNL